MSRENDGDIVYSQPGKEGAKQNKITNFEMFKEIRHRIATLSQQDMALENAYHLIKFKKSQRNKDYSYFFQSDPLFGEYVPDISQLDQFKNDTSISPDDRRLLYGNFREHDTTGLSVSDEQEAQFYDLYTDLARKWFYNKLEHYEDAHMNAYQLTLDEA